MILPRASTHLNQALQTTAANTALARRASRGKSATVGDNRQNAALLE